MSISCVVLVLLMMALSCRDAYFWAVFFTSWLVGGWQGAWQGGLTGVLGRGLTERLGRMADVEADGVGRGWRGGVDGDVVVGVHREVHVWG